MSVLSELHGVVELRPPADVRVVDTPEGPVGVVRHPQPPLTDEIVRDTIDQGRRYRLRRARSWLARSPQITTRRLTTDNAFAYVNSRSLRELLADRGIHHLTTRPYRPRTNGKVERFHQTMAREWAYGLSYASHHDRNQALPHWLEHYNTRDHTARSETDPRSAAFTTSVVGQLVNRASLYGDRQ